MLNMSSVLLRKQIQLLRPLLRNVDIDTERAFQDKLGALGSSALKGKVEYEDVELARSHGAWARPMAEDAQGGVVLYLHGGAYVAGTLDYARGFGGVLAGAVKRPVFCLGYRLAPEHPFPAALDDAMDAYEYLLSQGYCGENIVLAGESAGGGLCFCLCLYLKKKGMALPSCVVGISPWTDLAMSGKTYALNKDRDPSLFEENLVEYARMYGGEELCNPLVSPLYGELEGLPPTLMFVGTYELLLDDAVMMAEALARAQVDTTLIEAEGMWHVYVLFSTKESKDALERIDGFVDEHITA